jgi:hypothetical protein
MKLKVPCVEPKYDEVFEEKVERKFVKVATRHVTDGNVSYFAEFFKKIARQIIIKIIKIRASCPAPY